MGLSLISKVNINNIPVSCLSDAVINSTTRGCEDAELTFSKYINIKVGSKIDVYLGYFKYGLKPEFSGIVTEITSKSPLTVKCYDQSVKLGSQKISRSFTNEPLAKIVKQTAKGLQVVTDAAVLKKLATIVAPGITRRMLLSKLARDYSFITFFSGGKLFFVSPEFFEVFEEAVFSEGKNIIENNLKIKNKSISGEIYVPGHPFVRAGMYFSIDTEKVKGVYLADKVEISFGSNGFRRRIFPGKKSLKKQVK